MIFKIALRNALRQKRRTILTLLTMAGGFTLAAVSIGWSDGTYSYIIEMFTGNRLGQIQVHRKGYLDRPSLYDTIDDYQKIGAGIGGVEGVKTWAPRIFSAGLASLGDKTTGVQIIGIDPVREEAATHFNGKIVRGKALPAGRSREVVLGKSLSEILQARIGDEIVLVSQAADGSIANDIFRLSGIVETGDEVSDRMGLYLDLQAAQDFLALDDGVHEIIVLVFRLDQTGEITRRIRNRLDDPRLDVEPWQEFAKSFYVAMRADQQGMWIMLFVIILIVAVGVLNTVLMSVLERRREYGLMKALGTKPGQLVLAVLLETFFISIASVSLGAGFSTLVNYLLSVHGISLPTSFTYGGVEFSKLYTEVNARSLYIPTVTVVISAVLVSLPPALRAASTRPAAAMRTF